ncbi:MAG: hypothetical protein J0H60_12305, partial [Rhizobiales bacterium]|nr:hypothetical protein [Hyphomicrobiales bacterium]
QKVPRSRRKAHRRRSSKSGIQSKHQSRVQPGFFVPTALTGAMEYRFIATTCYFRVAAQL